MHDFFAAQKKGSATVQGAVQHLKNNGIAVEQLGIKSKAAAFGMNLLGAAVKATVVGLISWGISSLISSISDWIHESERLHEEAVELANNLESFDTTDIDTAATRMRSLREEMESGTLSANELSTAKAELLDIQNSLKETYGEEADGLSLVNGEIDTQIQKLDELKQKQAEAYIFENKGNIEKIKNDIENFNIPLDDNIIYEFHANSIANYDPASEVYNHMKNNDKYTGYLHQLISEDSRGQYEASVKILEQLQADAKEFEEKGGTAYEEYQDVISEFEKYITDNAQTYNDHLTELEALQEHQKVFASQYIDQKDHRNGLDFADQYNALTEAVTQYNEALMSGDVSAIQETKQELDDLNNWFAINAPNAPKDYVQAWETAFGEVSANAEENFYNVLRVVKVSQNDLEKLVQSGEKIDVNDFLSGELNGYSGATQAAFKNLVNAASEYGLSLEDLLPALRDIGIVTGQTAMESIQAFADLQSSVDEFSKEITTISEITANNGNMTVEQYNQLIGLSKDYASAIRYEAGEITVDSRKVNELAKARAEDQKAIVKEQKALKKLEYHKTNQELKKLIGTYDDVNTAVNGSIAKKLNELDVIAREITQYDLLIAQLDEATSAYANYERAKSETDYGDKYDTASNAFKDIDSGFETGKVGSKAFEAAVDLMVPEAEIEKGIANIHDYYTNTLSRYFQYDDSGNIVKQGIINFVQDSLDVGGLFTEDSTLDDFVVAEGVKLQDFADALGLTKDAVISFFGELEEYGYGVNFDFTDKLIEMAGDDVVALEQLEAQLLKTRQAMMENGEWVDSNGELTDGAKEINQQYADVIKAEQEAADNIARGLARNAQNTEKLEQESAKLDDLVAERQKAADEGNTEAVAEFDKQIDNSLSRIEYLKSQLVEPTELNIQIATDEIDRQLEEINGRIQEIMSSAEVTGSGQFVDPAVQEEMSELINRKNELTSEKEILLNMDVKDVEKDLEVTEENLKDIIKLAESIVFDVDTKPLSKALSKVRTEIDQLVSSAKIKIQNLFSLFGFDFGSTTSTSKSTGVTGTGTDIRDAIAAGGGASAHGMSSSPVATTSLVGEVKPEMLVRGNQWRLIGQNGPEFMDIRKGDIILDGDTTEDLLSRGHSNKRGKAYAHGKSGQALMSGGLAGLTTDWSTVISDAISSASKDASKDVADSMSDYLDEIEILLTRIDTHIGNLEAATELSQTYRNKNSVIDKNMEVQSSKLSALEKAYDRYMQQAYAVGLSSDWQKKIISGQIDIENIDDEDLRKQIDAFQEWYDKAVDCKNQIFEVRQSLRDLTNEKLDNIVNDFDLLIQLQEAYVTRQNAMISLNAATGKAVTENDYKEVIELQREVTNYLSGELQQLQSEFNTLVEEGKITAYTEDWYTWLTTIEEQKEALLSSTESLQEYVSAIRELRWKEFNEGIETIEQLESEIDSLQNLVGNAPLFSDNGKLTNAGKTTMALYTQQLRLAKQRAEEYNVAIDALNKDFKNGNISQETYNELLDEYSSAQREAASDTRAAEQALIDLRIEGIDKVTEAYEEYINIQKKDHQAKKEYDNYLKSLSEKNDEMTAIQMQISALEGNEENRTQIKKLQQELLKLNDEYLQMKQDHEYDMIEQGYNEQLEIFQQNQEDEKERLESDQQYRKQVIDESASYTKDQYQDVYDYITMLGEVYNQKITPSLTEPWESASAAAEHYIKTVQEAQSQTVIDTSKIDTGKTTAKDTPKANEKVLKDLDSAPQIKTVQSSQKPSPSVSSNNNPKASQTKGIIGWGDTGADVKTIQSALNKLGYSAGTVDGIFGANTYSAVVAFQKKMGISADGLVGDKTRQKFKEAGFSSGGIAKVVKGVGEDGIALVKNGEGMIPADQVSQFKALVRNAGAVNELIDRYPLYAGAVNRQSPGINVTYGNLIGEYVASSNDNKEDVTKVFRQAFDNEMRRFGQYFRKMGYGYI